MIAATHLLHKLAQRRKGAGRLLERLDLRSSQSLVVSKPFVEVHPDGVFRIEFENASAGFA